MEISTAARLVFGKAGNAAPAQRMGWAAPDEGHTWSVGPRADLVLTLAAGQGDLLIELVLRPFMHPPLLVRQKVQVLVDEVPAGEAVVQDESAVSFRVPAAQLAGKREIAVALLCPQSVCPSDLGVSSDIRSLGFSFFELLAIWVPPEQPVYPRHLPPLPITAADPPARVEALVGAMTGLSVLDLMMSFESLGHNCEFGIVQRGFRAEPLGLLRFVGIPKRELLLGLDYSFEGVDDPDATRVYAADEAEWMIRNARYELHSHTFQNPSTIDAETIRAQEVTKLTFKRRRFVEVLASGEKLFVYQSAAAMTEAHALPILNLLRSHGRNALLFVTPSATLPSGSVDRLAVDLYRGNIDRLAPHARADQSNRTGWLSICANAYRLWRESGLGG